MAFFTLCTIGSLRLLGYLRDNSEIQNSLEFLLSEPTVFIGVIVPTFILVIILSYRNIISDKLSNKVSELESTRKVEINVIQVVKKVAWALIFPLMLTIFQILMLWFPDALI